MTNAIRNQMPRDKKTCEEELGEYNVDGDKGILTVWRREERNIQVEEEDDDSFL
jgi:hypothetical protein